MGSPDKRTELNAWRAERGLEPLPTPGEQIAAWDGVDARDVGKTMPSHVGKTMLQLVPEPYQTPTVTWYKDTMGVGDMAITNAWDGIGRANSLTEARPSVSIMSFGGWLHRQCIHALAAMGEVVGHDQCAEYQLWHPSDRAHTVASFAEEMRPVVIRALAVLMDLNEAIRLCAEKFPDVVQAEGI